MTHPFVRSVIDVTPCFRPSYGKTCSVDRVAVILRGDVTTSGDEIESRDVLRTVSVLEFDRLGAGGEREKLMSQADSEDGFVIDVKKGTKIGDGRRTVSWISRSIGQENPIIQMCDFLNGVVVGVDSDISPSPDKTANDIFLDSTINESDI